MGAVYAEGICCDMAMESVVVKRRTEGDCQGKRSENFKSGLLTCRRLRFAFSFVDLCVFPLLWVYDSGAYM